jgi:signal transduction histidine kinase
LCQAFLNLLTNAKDALKLRNRRVLSIAARTSNNEVEVEFADTGGGIPGSIINRIFEPFFTTKAPGEGTGLGLAITRSIVQNYGGTIRVETREGEGSLFVLSFPLSPREAVPV